MRSIAQRVVVWANNDTRLAVDDVVVHSRCCRNYYRLRPDHRVEIRTLTGTAVRSRAQRHYVDCGAAHDLIEATRD